MPFSPFCLPFSPFCAAAHCRKKREQKLQELIDQENRNIHSQGLYWQLVYNAPPARSSMRVFWAASLAELRVNLPSRIEFEQLNPEARKLTENGKFNFNFKPSQKQTDQVIQQTTYTP
jgi:hypothetical protein